MRRKLLFRLGRVLDKVGSLLQRWPNRLQNYGMNLWDANCDCEKCLARQVERKDY